MVKCTVKSTFSSLIFAMFAGFFSPAQAGVPVSPDLPDLVEKILPSVVNVGTETIVKAPNGWEDYLGFWGIPKERKQSALGSGFIVDAAKGLILTNHHVVAQADELMITLQDKRKLRARLVGSDAKLDLALLQVRDDKRQIPGALQAVKIGDSDKVRIAEPVLAIGNPFGLQHTVTMGIISAKNRTIGLGPFDNFLQTDASINPGNSGGPLFNTKGEVIGINSVIFSRTGQSGGLGFAIPVNEAVKILPSLERYGRVPRPWLGVMAEKVTPPLARYHGLPRKDGVVLYNMVEDGPADRSGLRIGDVLIKVGDRKLEEPLDLEREISSRKPGDTVVISLQRGRKEIEMKLKLTEFPAGLENRLPQGIL